MLFILSYTYILIVTLSLVCFNSALLTQTFLLDSHLLRLVKLRSLTVFSAFMLYMFKYIIIILRASVSSRGRDLRLFTLKE